MSQASWRPNVPESQLFDEKTWLQGAILSAVAYGINLALFILNVSLLRKRTKLDIKQDSRPRQTTCLLIYVCVMFILSTLTVASQAKMTQLGFIENRDFPGGPAAYQELMFSIPISSLGNYCFSLMNWFSDSLLLWRCSVIYKSSRTSIWLVMAIPGLMLLASFITGIIYLDRISRPSSSPWANTNFTLIYGIISLSLNIVLTLMIVIRLYLHRRNITKLLGRRHAAHYTSIISILIESAAVLDVMVIFFLIPFAMGNPIANIPLSSMVQVQATASYMIIFRVAQGTAWTSRTMYSELTIHGMTGRPNNLSDLRFRSTTIDHPADSVTLQSRNQFPLDEPHDVLDVESNGHGTVHESRAPDPAIITEKAGPNVK
ncbi:hypothetical protein BYT27DRAFT_7335314 [Phlegmacium glaucopus]|nr:hypothetical protein BYT27DRAFT_7335314 [Phlegmacium glaucopus]